MKIQTKKEMPLLGRVDYTLEIEYDAATPSTASVKTKLASLIKHDESLLVVKHIYPKFGEKKAIILASAYNDAASMKHIEEVKKKVKTAKQEKGAEKK